MYHRFDLQKEKASLRTWFRQPLAKYGLPSTAPKTAVQGGREALLREHREGPRKDSGGADSLLGGAGTPRRRAGDLMGTGREGCEFRGRGRKVGCEGAERGGREVTEVQRHRPGRCAEDRPAARPASSLDVLPRRPAGPDCGPKNGRVAPKSARGVPARTSCGRGQHPPPCSPDPSLSCDSNLGAEPPPGAWSASTSHPLGPRERGGEGCLSPPQTGKIPLLGVLLSSLTA